MKLKRFFASDPLKAMRDIKATLGENAVIISSRTSHDGVEIVAGIASDIDIADKTSAKASFELNTYQKFQANDSNVFVHDEDSLFREIRYLRELVETEVASLAWQSNSYRYPIQMILLKRLLHMGFRAEYAHKLILKVGDGQNVDKSWHVLLAHLLDDIRFEENFFYKSKGIYAFVGSTGVGKTTTIAKIAARFSYKNTPEDVGLIITDTNRVGATEQLMIYAKVLGINILVAQDKDTFEQCVSKFQHKRLVLVDTSGLNPNDENIHTQYEFLKHPTVPITSILILSATHQDQVQDKVIQRFGTFSPVGCIITKIDECAQSGGILSSLIEEKMRLLYMTTGQNVPEDIISANKRNVLNMLIEKYSSNPCLSENADPDLALSQPKIANFEGT